MGKMYLYIIAMNVFIVFSETFYYNFCYLYLIVQLIECDAAKIAQMIYE